MTSHRDIEQTYPARKPAHQIDRKSVVDALAANYPEVQYAFVHFLSEHLVDCCRSFDGDLEIPLILSVVGQAHIAAFLAKPDERHNRIDYGVSALRVADITGLPRETVRRKLKRMEKAGWLRDTPAGWTLEGQNAVDVVAKRDLEDLDRRGIDRLARLYIDLSRILGQAGIP